LSSCCRCNASNIAGDNVAHTYLHVFSPEVNSLADMSGLVYPMIPLPLTTAASTTSYAHNSTFDSSFTPTSTRHTDPPRTSASRYLGAADVTSSAARDLNWMTSEETDMVVVIVAGVTGACLMAFLICILLVLVVRRHLRSGKYDPSRPHLGDDGCRRHFLLCCPTATGPDSADNLEFDTSTVRLKLNTSATSATSTADRSYVSDRPLTNQVTTRNDSVQQTLIGRPSTNDAQSTWK